MSIASEMPRFGKYGIVAPEQVAVFLGFWDLPQHRRHSRDGSPAGTNELQSNRLESGIPVLLRNDFPLAPVVNFATKLI